MYKITIVGAELKGDRSIETIKDDLKNRLEEHIPDIEFREDNNVGTLFENFRAFGRIEEEDDEIISIDSSFEIGEHTLEVRLYKETYKSDLYTLELEGSKEISNDYWFDLRNESAVIFQRAFKEFYWVHDDFNQKISAELYEKIHNVENNMRDLIIQYMLKIHGVKWFENNILPKYREKSIEFNNWFSTSEYQTFKKVKSELYNLQVLDLINMLKESYSNKYLNRVNSAFNEIRRALGDDSEQVISSNLLELDNIWKESKFEELLGVDFGNEWEEFSKLRNIIAHNKLICKKLNTDISSKSINLNRKINKARMSVERIISSKQDHEIRLLIDEIDHEFYMEDSGLKEYNDSQDVIEELQEEQALFDFYNELYELENNGKNIIEEIESTIESVKDIAFDNIIDKTEFLTKLINLLGFWGYEDVEFYQKLCELENEDLLSELFSLILDKIEEIDYSLEEKHEFWDIDEIDSFCETINMKIPRVLRNNIYILLDGDISPCFGDSDLLFIEARENDNRDSERAIARGTIDIQYGDYEIDDDTGTGRKSLEQSITINFSELNELLEEISNEYNELKEINESIMEFL